MNKKILHITAFTGGKDLPSSRFRIRQHIPNLEINNIFINEYCPVISQHSRLPGTLGNINLRYLPPVAAAQVILNGILRLPGTLRSYKDDFGWIERNFIPNFDSLVCLTKGPRILDVDDAIWMSSRFAERSCFKMARKIDAVIAGNDFIANWYSQYCNKIYTIPTAVNSEIFLPKVHNLNNNNFIIGWTGTSSNFKYLYIIERSLHLFIKDYPHTRLLILADKMPKFNLIPEKNIIFIQWKENIEASILDHIDVGIMPLIDNDWTKGKCSFKMLQYMAKEIPVLVSSVGNNLEVLKNGNCGYGIKNNEDWYEYLKDLYLTPDKRKKMGLIGREIIKKFYDTKVISNQLKNVFQSFNYS